ncbi:MAG: cobalamin B12-binding domain-containing protein [Eubacteriaceae bacterium]
MKESIINAIKELDDDLTLLLVKDAFNKGFTKYEILKWMNLGMNEVGKLYEETEYYIADLIMSGIIYRKVLDLQIMSMDSDHSNLQNSIGKIIIGTVEDDIHDIGKDIFISIAKSESFEVYDLGVDVRPNTFLEKVLQIQPDIVGMSGIITNSIKCMKETVDLLSRNFVRNDFKIIIGGISISEEMCRYIGADFATSSADNGIDKCKKWIREKYEQSQSS